jgi:methionyl-tRNA formyltransferase
MLLPGPILFFGMHGPFSIAPLQALLAAQASIAAVIIPAIPQQHAAIEPLAPHAGPLQPANIVHLAWQSEVPVYAARHCGPEVIEKLAPLAPAVACVACWPYRIPPELLALPRAGFLNIHPSLLPALPRAAPPLLGAARWAARNRGDGTLDVRRAGSRRHRAASALAPA